MDINILLIIFSKVSSCDLFWNVSCVCKSWQSACWDFLFWSTKSLDLITATRLRDLPLPAAYLGVLYEGGNSNFLGKLDEEYNKMSAKLMRLLCSILGDGDNDPYPSSSLEHWRLSINAVFIPIDLHISDEHLLYIAERINPSLEWLYLVGASKITYSCVAAVLSHWKDLKYLNVGPLKSEYLTDIIKTIEIKCCNLKMLYIHSKDFCLNLENAVLLGNWLPRLWVLGFEGATLYKMGRGLLIDPTIALERIVVSQCYLVDELRGEHKRGPYSFQLTWKNGSDGPEKWELKCVRKSDIESWLDLW